MVSSRVINDTMKYTPEQLKDLHAAIDAHRAGKPCEVSVDGGCNWNDVNPANSTWAIGVAFFRPKAEPKTRPWSKPDDVPGSVCWIKPAGSVRAYMAMVVGFYFSGIRVVTSEIDEIEYTEIHKYEYSTDRKTWLPCTTIEP